jgi:hypothetical protein
LHYCQQNGKMLHVVSQQVELLHGCWKFDFGSIMISLTNHDDGKLHMERECTHRVKRQTYSMKHK